MYEMQETGTVFTAGDASGNQLMSTIKFGRGRDVPIVNTPVEMGRWAWSLQSARWPASNAQRPIHARRRQTATKKYCNMDQSTRATCILFQCTPVNGPWVATLCLKTRWLAANIFLLAYAICLRTMQYLSCQFSPPNPTSHTHPHYKLLSACRRWVFDTVWLSNWIDWLIEWV